MVIAETLSLPSGASMPVLGFGTFRVADATAEDLVCEAISQGYRLIDTAQGYGNEAGVGRGLAAVGIARDELFVTTKVSNDHHGREAAYDSVRRSLDDLNTGYLDLVLIHWPLPHLGLAGETWDALIRLRDEGSVRDIGLSNFTGVHLKRILAQSSVPPAVNQIEWHPYFTQFDAHERHQELGIVTQSWSSLGRGGLLGDPALQDIAAQMEVSVARIVLRWHLQRGIAPLVKSSSPQRMRDNLDVFGFELSSEQMRRIDALDGRARVGPDPDRYGGPECSTHRTHEYTH